MCVCAHEMVHVHVCADGWLEGEHTHTCTHRHTPANRTDGSDRVNWGGEVGCVAIFLLSIALF